MPFAPNEEELLAALVELRRANPTLGVAKLHALLLASHEDWIVSLKRTTKVLKEAGLTLQSSLQAPSPGTNNPSGSDRQLWPSSQVMASLDVTKYSSKVEVKYFDKEKGKGLVAKDEIKEGEVIWKEDPWIVAPEWQIYDLQVTGKACAFCSTLLSDSSLLMACSASSSSTFCPARFCNRLCLSRSAKIHPLLCAAQNPASVKLMKFVRQIEWMALHALSCVTARVLLAYQLDPATTAAKQNRKQGEASKFDKDWEFLRSLAELGMEDRIANSVQGSDSGGVKQSDLLSTWTEAHKFFIQAFKTPSNPADAKKLGKILKKPLSEEVDGMLFNFKPEFLRGLGRMSLNLEAHGGLYVLHSHLNHSCAPNVSIRHLDQRTALARITVIAKQDIQPGEELLITYVNPKSGVRWRRRELDAWGFGECMCERCVEDAKNLGPEKELEEDPFEQNPFDLKELESEIKTGLGVM